MKKVIFILLAVISFSCKKDDDNTPKPDTQPDTTVVLEIKGYKSDKDGYYLDIYNKSQVPVDLKGYRVITAECETVFASSLVISPNSGITSPVLACPLEEYDVVFLMNTTPKTVCTFEKK